MKKKNLKKLIILNIPYIVIGLVATNIGEAFRISGGTNASEKVRSVIMDGCFGTAFANPLPSFHPVDLFVGLAIGGILRLAVYIKSKNAKKFRHNQEYGSARWGTHEDIEPYMDPVFKNNVILSKTERITTNSRPSNPKYARNLNVACIGGSGSGKTRFFIKPNILQMNSSLVVTDPNADVMTEAIAVHWIKHIYQHQPSALHEQISFLRTFGKYQSSLGKTAYVIQEQYSSGKSVFVPYLMTDKELEELFAAIDTLWPRDGFKQLQMSTYFRLTYTCGLRPREGRELLRKDVDLDNAEIRIVNTKWHKSRTIVMSDDMADLMKKYVSARDARFDINTYVFPKPQGGPYTAAAIMNSLRRAFAKSKPDVDKELLPAIRVYDLRHRFATKVLHNWLDSGTDLNARLPYLQTYMGHTELNATAYYIHLLPENLVRSAGVDWERLNSLLPEVELWEK